MKRPPLIRGVPFSILFAPAMLAGTLLQPGCLTGEEIRAVASNSLQSFVNGLFGNVIKDLANALFGLN